jgi:hypothetical protein
MKKLLALLALAPAALALADEGMWTYDNFPAKTVKQRYGFEPDQKWLDHVRLSSARLAGGCSASFVSGSGLVMTNHHCAQQCIDQLSTAQKDYFAAGFYAKQQPEEVKCPTMEVNQLVEISDVTARVQKATAGLKDKAYGDAQRSEQAKIEKECASSDKLRCDVVPLYHGGRYHLYKYKRFQDVRLVFAPEFAIAFFGGDPDNFMFPRYDLDVSFVRVYEEGKPAKMDHYFKWSQAGVKENDLTFVSGHPGGTDRQLTVAELEYSRDVQLPDRLIRMSELRGILTEMGEESAEHKRISQPMLFGIENGFKALRGRLDTLLDKEFMATKLAAEKDFRAKISADPARKAKYAAAFDQIAKAEDEIKKIRRPINYIGLSGAFQSSLFHTAQALLRAGDELVKPNGDRLREFHDSSLPELKQHLFSAAPIYDDLEITTLTFSLTKMREDLGADHPFVRSVLGKESPREMATRLVKGSKLKEVALRKKLFDGGKKAVAADKDPMIELARAIDSESRSWRKKLEDEFEPIFKKSSELLAQARFDLEGTAAYPDATFTLRLSYGAVKGYEELGRTVKPITYVGGAFERATGRHPFELPESWVKAKSKLDMATPMNFCSTNDIIGGNSGSPVVNRDAEIVGLVFDGNIQSLGGDYWFDASVNRTVAVHSEALIEALRKVYGADRIASELRPASGAGAGK